MKRAIWVVIALGLIPGRVHAAWDPAGNNVTQGIVQRFDHYPHLARDGGGGAFVAWDTEDDWQPYDRDVAICRVASNGDVLWSALVSGQAGIQRGSEIVEDGTGGAIVVWFDERTTGVGAGIYAQRYDSTGVAQWTTDGEFMSDLEPLLLPPLEHISVVSDGANGAILAWQDYSQIIRVQRIRYDGYRPWGAFALPVTTTPSGGETWSGAATDGAGGAIVTWVRFDGSVGVNFDVRAQRFNAAGVRLWGNAGIPVTNSPASDFPQIVPAASGGAIVLWHQFEAETELRLQQLDAAGNRLWGLDGVTVSTGINVTENSGRLVGDGANGAFVTWMDNRNDSDAADLFAVHVLGTGVVSAQKQLTTSYSVVEDPIIVRDGAGGAFVAWRLKQMVNGPIKDLVYYQWLDSSGNNLLTNGGELLYDQSAAQLTPQALLTSPGQFIVTWEDERNQPFSTDCFAKLVEGNTVAGTNVVVSPVDLTTGTSPVTLTFSDVTSAGTTSLSTGSGGPALPGTFTFSGTYYNLTTTAGYNGTIEICIVDSAIVPVTEPSYMILHYNGTTWEDVTSFLDMWQHKICATTTSLSPFVVGYGTIPSPVGDSPRSFALHANVPNPFNPVTTITYDVGGAGANVEISVFDAAGRLVRELVNEHRAAGTWSVQWSGDDNRGQRVASGVYFYRMRAGDFVETKKMVLLK